MSEQYGKIEEYKSFDLHKIGKLTPFPRDSNDSEIKSTYYTLNNINNYLKSKNGYIIHNFNTLNRQFSWNHCQEAHNPAYSNYIINAIDNFGNMHRNINSFNYYKQISTNIFDYNISTHSFDNKLSNKSIKLIKDLDYCSEDDMQKLIKNLLEDKEEDIHFMKNKVKELEDTNKDLLLKMDEMNAKHNELVNKLLDRIVELGGKN